MSIAILIVDDSPSVRAAIMRALPAGLDVTVEEASDGAIALRACARAAPDVMFLDLAMPEVDGYAVLRALQSHPRRPRVVVVSTDATRVARASLVALGADEVLDKPWPPGEIELALRRMGVVGQ